MEPLIHCYESCGELASVAVNRQAAWLAQGTISDDTANHSHQWSCLVRWIGQEWMIEGERLVLSGAKTMVYGYG